MKKISKKLNQLFSGMLFEILKTRQFERMGKNTKTKFFILPEFKIKYSYIDF